MNQVATTNQTPVWQICYRTKTGGYYWGYDVCRYADQAKQNAMRRGITFGNGYEIWAILPVEDERADEIRAEFARNSGAQ